MLTINTVPSQMGPSTNKRNAVLIQSFMADILSVPAERGILTFIAIPEENLAQHGNTMLGEMERQEKQSGAGGQTGVKSALSEAARKSMSFNKNSRPALNGVQSNGHLTAESSSTQSVTPPPQLAAGTREIHELPGSANTKNERPSTAHGAFAAENGLRMNGISTEQLVGKDSRTPNGRPKTFGGGESASIQDSLFKKEPLPQLPNPTSTQSQQRPSKPEQRKSSGAVPTKSTLINTVPLAPRPVQQVPKSTTTSKTAKHISSSETRAKNTYLDNVSSLTKKGTEPAIVVTKEEDENDDDVPLSKIANTSKRRRSTITATPKIPPPKPPPVPDTETKSVASRLGKRKSFLRMFKRQSTPAWYE